MPTNFWQQLNKPIIGLSPMDGVTDAAFRQITKKYGAPDIMYTEFTNVEGLCHGATQLLKPLIYHEAERPIIAQIFGKTPKYFRQVAVLLCELEFDGIDINMGCPAKNVAQHGSGAALIQTPQLAQEIIKETKAGVQDFQNGKRIRDCVDLKKLLKKSPNLNKKKSELKNNEVPVSVKTRIGYDKPVTKDWITTLLETQPAAIALHGRTLKQGYSGSANWEQIGLAAQLTKKTKTLILGNGDVNDRQEAEAKAKQYGVDGVLIGRAAFGNPYVFQSVIPHPVAGSLAKLAYEHARLYEQIFASQEKYSFLPIRKHLGWYINGIEHAKEIRIKLMQTNSAQEVESVFHEFNLI